MLIPSELNALVIDDNDHGRALAEHALKQVGVTNVFGAVDVIAALEILRHNKIDFILLDWYIPEINGAGLVRLLRKGYVVSEQQANMKEMPIIVTTAYATRENTARIRELGLKEILAKPFSVKQLNAAISIAMAPLMHDALNEQSDSADKQTPDSDYLELSDESEEQILL